MPKSMNDASSELEKLRENQNFYANNKISSRQFQHGTKVRVKLDHRNCPGGDV